MSHLLNSEAGKRDSGMFLEKQEFSLHLANLAVKSLIEEAELTPKPGLVDKDNSGSHSDMTFKTMIQSAEALEPTFRGIAEASFKHDLSQELREEIAAIGRRGEFEMLEATGGINTHKGAIWALGLLVSSIAMNPDGSSLNKIAFTAGELARFSDRNLTEQMTNGKRAKDRYGVNGAKGEAQQGFPHLIKVALPELFTSRNRGIEENHCRINALVALMASVDDTCILHRGGAEALSCTKSLAAEILASGGVSTKQGWKLLGRLDQSMRKYNASPGGSADLLAAALFLDFFQQSRTQMTQKQQLLLNY
ncbi:triphosphoribosyl-dephospho-CoA synthase [Mesobacillus boroniphilus]|nr:triphosphoribosyl-dephospho-CoA synthase [Mesobacillus boroniphilus]